MTADEGTHVGQRFVSRIGRYRDSTIGRSRMELVCDLLQLDRQSWTVGGTHRIETGEQVAATKILFQGVARSGAVDQRQECPFHTAAPASIK